MCWEEGSQNRYSNDRNISKSINSNLDRWVAALVAMQLLLGDHNHFNRSEKFAVLAARVIWQLKTQPLRSSGPYTSRSCAKRAFFWMYSKRSSGRRPISVSTNLCVRSAS